MFATRFRRTGSQAGSELRRRGVGGRVLGAVVVLLAGWLAIEWAMWPDVELLTTSNPEATAFTRRHDVGRESSTRLDWVPYGEIATSLKVAVLVAEDINFFAHRGFETSELKAALRQAVEERRPPRGASTLSQQLAKNLWLSPARTPRRKLREALLTRDLEATLDKRRILEIYLNVVEFGEGVFGCGAASRRFFGKRAGALTLREAARLAAVLPRPRSWRADGSDRDFLVAVDRIERRAHRASWLRREL